MAVYSTVWNTWVTSSASTTISISNPTWINWVTTSTGGTGNTQLIWANWTNATTATTTQWTVQNAAAPTEEQRARWAQEAAERETRWQAREAEREARHRADLEALEVAKVRAEETLRAVLDDEQWAAWESDKRFELITQSGRRYRVARGISHNIKLIAADSDREVESLCAYPRRAIHDDAGNRLGQLPAEDVVIAQVLALRSDEEGFRRVANIHRIAA